MAIGDYLPRRARVRNSGNEANMYPSRLLPVSGLGRIFDEAFSDFFETFPTTKMLDDFSPRINISDTPNEIRVVAELPGIDVKDVDLNLTNDGLILSGEKREERPEDEKHRYYECSYGCFQRYIPLHSEIKREGVKAEYDKGRLIITLPKSDTAKSQNQKVQIQVTGGNRQSVDVGGDSRKEASSNGTPRNSDQSKSTIDEQQAHA